MKATKKLGIWMDHSIAYLMEFTSNPFEIKTIESKFTQLKKMEALAKSESLMHNKEQQQLSNYYKKLGEEIKNYKRVLLFGPTNAKMELFDILSQDERFATIKIEIKETDKMTVNQKNAFVREYFSKA
ncbi:MULTISPECIES: hypothetical protein [unclassified Flavobacterium]|jgi:hypothetical protein|uniref:hypothetical protein n=1 Tax=unclassified Flavobacterium TaxID=196869 RepID=UPI0025B9E373|nr:MULTISPECIES: hypothetical protein [unclassified Flavobacterium]